MSDTKYSLIIPCYNEEGNIEQLVSRCRSVIENEKVEIVFVDNGSTDDTNNKLSRLTKDQPMFQLVKVNWF